MNKRILVVEDQEDNRQILRDLLGSAGYELTEAENGVEAIAAVAARDLVSRSAGSRSRCTVGPSESRTRVSPAR